MGVPWGELLWQVVVGVSEVVGEVDHVGDVISQLKYVIVGGVAGLLFLFYAFFFLFYFIIGFWYIFLLFLF
jgi:hypothetical protein